MTTSQLLEHSLLYNAAQKEIRNFSSGMRQRLRLGLALFTKSDLILLDEPTSNLDPQGVIWYRELIEKERDDRTLVIGSNFDPGEMDFCSHQLKMNHARRLSAGRYWKDYPYAPADWGIALSLPKLKQTYGNYFRYT
ncbi:MAG: ATP-binding cassette domain-containing protein [Owenweeksia sp.]|nr:ATP-binding cassette domain-containing protein [Owenweeksia sp.]